MNRIKKAGIITGAVVGGVIGGTISVVGKVSKQKFIDELGESIVDSTILTGGIAGDLASGATQVVSGTIEKRPEKVAEGKGDLKTAGGKVVNNVITNTKQVVTQGGEIVDGVKKRDLKKVVRSTKTLVKMAAVGAITVGAVKVNPGEDEKSMTNDLSENRPAENHTTSSEDSQNAKEEDK